MPDSILANRLGVFVELAESVKGNLGRTTLMKLCYFLQTVRDVPLGYDFTLYSYGPFDSDVLSDLQTAENMGVLHTDIEHYSGGYKYDIQPGEQSAKARTLANGFLETYSDDIQWVTQKFGNRSAAELELLSTIVFVRDNHQVSDLRELADRVKTVKPHFTVPQIRRQIEWLQGEELID